MAKVHPKTDEVKHTGDTPTRHQKGFEPQPKWKPEVGSIIPAHLPSEIVLARVAGYKNDDEMEVVLDVRPPMSKTHGYFFRSKVTLHRAKMSPSGEKWIVPDEA